MTPARVSLVVTALFALALGIAWWLGAGLLSSDGESACVDALAADLAFVSAHAGLLLAIGALVAAAKRALRIGWWSLVAYATLFALSFAAAATCS